MKFKFVIVVLLLFVVIPESGFSKTRVQIKGKKGNWKFYVDGDPFELKGVGVNSLYGMHGENYLKMAKELGANAVRTWNYRPGGYDRAFLDKAHELDLYVASWLWLNPTHPDNPYVSYKSNSPYCQLYREKVKQWVNEIKDHPALLMYGVGNEVIFFSHSDQERIWFAKFLNELCQMIHKIDPDHPVIYASAFEHGLSYLAKYTPDLDIVGMNMYSHVITMHKHWERNKFNIPYIFTEFGPVNMWGVGKDENDYPVDPHDWHKAGEYKRIMTKMKKYKGQLLGGFVFTIGELYQVTDSWWTLNWRDLKRASFWETYKFYTGKEPDNRAPRISSVKISKVKDLEPFEEITVKVRASDPDGDPLTIDYDLRMVKDGIVTYMPDEYWEEVMTPIEGGFKLSVPSFKSRFILYILVKDDHGNVAVANRSLVVGD
ncbi:MAG: hypothetical protein JW827_04015 [Spirochaetes bacterium]|nr:hypothetical protein [Spirochaetota bacterium]